MAELVERCFTEKITNTPVYCFIYVSEFLTMNEFYSRNEIDHMVNNILINNSYIQQHVINILVHNRTLRTYERIIMTAKAKFH